MCGGGGDKPEIVEFRDGNQSLPFKGRFFYENAFSSFVCVALINFPVDATLSRTFFFLFRLFAFLFDSNHNATRTKNFTFPNGFRVNAVRRIFIFFSVCCVRIN